MRSAVLVVLAVGVALSSASAQGTSADTGSVVGRVIDARSGAPLAHAEVRIDDPNGRSSVSDTRGVFRISGIAAGGHRLRVRLLGFRANGREIVIRTGALTRVEIALDGAALPLDEIVVTASRRDQRLADVAVTTEVVRREDIEQSGTSDLAAVLTEHTGIELQGGHPSGAGLMLQGIGSERVLVLLDGQPVAGRISGVFDVSRIPVAVVERIEIVKGPQSTLYGSEAMGGVVNIITREPDESPFAGRLSLTAGTQDRRDATGGVSMHRGALSLGADVNWRTIQNTPGREQVEGALAERTDGLVTMRWTASDRLRVEGSVLALDERQRWRSGSLYSFADNRQWNGRLAAAWRAGAHAITGTAAASSFDHLSRGSIAAKPIAGDTGQRQVQRVVKAELLYNAGFAPTRIGLRALDLGFEIEREDTESDRVQGHARALTTAEPFAQLEFGGARWTVLPGVRLTWNEQWGTHVTPRVASRVQLAESVTLRTSAGTGFRAPDFKELYMFFQNESANYVVVGNEELRPETSRNITTSVEWAGRRGYARGQLFWNEFRDFIETRAITEPGAPPVFQYANIDDGSTRGMELETGVSWRSVRAEGGMSYLTTQNRATGQSLLGRPTHGARLTISLDRIAGTSAAVSSIYTGRTPMQRDVETGAVSAWRDPYLRTDVRLTRPIAFGLDLSFGVDNVFDRQPAQWAAFTGRHVYTALSWQASATR
jgi:outer membrane receptor for ferrienterochelin and colicins